MYNRAPANSHLGTSAAPPDDHEAPKILRGGNRVTAWRFRGWLRPARLRQQRAHAPPLWPIEEDAVRSDELEPIPLDRVVTGGDGDAARGAVMLDGQLDRGGGNEADVDHVASRGGQAGRDGRRERRARGAGIAPQHHRLAPPVAGSLPHPPPERLGPTSYDLRRQVLAHDATHARDPDHQGVGHAGNLIGRG